MAPAAAAAAPAVSHAEYVAEREPYYKRRIELFEQHKQRSDGDVEAARAADAKIKVVLPDGKEVEAIKGATTPLNIAEGISSSLAKKSVVAKVDGKAWDMFRPLETSCTLELCNFNDPEGKDTFWHSSAHVLGQALELEFGADLTIGPTIEEGFYYDCSLGDRTLTETDKETLAKRMKSAVSDSQRFQRVEICRADALEMFTENKFKVELIENLAEDARITVYRVGPMVDLCSGPHLPSTSFLKALDINSVSRAFWRADITRDPLQRVYAITYPDKKLLADYKHRISEAKKRDHRVLGTRDELFFFHHLSPGSAFFQPYGTRIYNGLVQYIRDKYWEYEYDEVVTPNMYNFELWHTSGHADHYKDNMFAVPVEKQEFGLKPMNCPGHCLMFASRTRSYRELPLRLADFGVLHRNEYSGALHGLTRVRRFQQDDAHIFCRSTQVKDEVTSFLRMMGEVYGVLGLQYSMALSTRPDKFMGEPEMWDQAETALEEALNECGREWRLDPGEGAFYGPKIDITVYDALRRSFQCATVQLDFQLPIRFDLEYQTEDGMERPVIVHRAILGSVERMYAILTEHYAGKWPLWISPRQACIVPISAGSVGYAQQCRRDMRKHGLYVDVDERDLKMQKKVREAQLGQYNYILVVGEQERGEGLVNVRTRDNQVHGARKLTEVIERLKEERDSKAKECCFHKEAEAGTPEGESAAGNVESKSDVPDKALLDAGVRAKQHTPGESCC